MVSSLLVDQGLLVFAGGIHCPITPSLSKDIARVQQAHNKLPISVSFLPTRYNRKALNCRAGRFGRRPKAIQSWKQVVVGHGVRYNPRMAPGIIPGQR